jgi:hypothetical protein
LKQTEHREASASTGFVASTAGPVEAEASTDSQYFDKLSPIVASTDSQYFDKLSPINQIKQNFAPLQAMAG